MSGMYLDIKTSLLAFCKRSKHQLSMSSVEIFDFDTHAVENKLPDRDIIGIGDYSLTDNDETHHGTCSIAVCTLSDDSLCERLSGIIDYLYSNLKPGTQVPVVKKDSGEQVGYLTILTPMTALPISDTQTRPVQEILINFGVALDTPPQ